jgi:hypothetical protein
MKKVLLIVTGMMFLAGCNAQESATLLTGDTIHTSTGKIRTAVNAYDKSVTEGIARLKESIRQAAIQEFGDGVTTMPASQDTPEQKAASLMARIDVIMQDEHTRTRNYEMVMEELDYIDYVATELQKLTVYTASVNAQTKAWMMAQLRANEANKKGSE